MVLMMVHTSQIPFSVSNEDDAPWRRSYYESIALDILLPCLSNRSFIAHAQDHNLATYYGRRTPRMAGWTGTRVLISF